MSSNDESERKAQAEELRKAIAEIVSPSEETKTKEEAKDLLPGESLHDYIQRKMRQRQEGDPSGKPGTDDR